MFPAFQITCVFACIHETSKAALSSGSDLGRLSILSLCTHQHTTQPPIIAMYVAGSGVLPLPFRASIESALGRPAVTLMDYDKVRCFFLLAPACSTHDLPPCDAAQTCVGGANRATHSCCCSLLALCLHMQHCTPAHTHPEPNNQHPSPPPHTHL